MLAEQFVFALNTKEYFPSHKGHPRNKRETAYESGILVDFWGMACILCSVFWLRSSWHGSPL